jgi:hypothetical protein
MFRLPLRQTAASCHLATTSVFGVEPAPRAVTDPRAWMRVLRGVFRSLRAIRRGQPPVRPMNPYGGRFDLPAGFLIASDGRVPACMYASHAYDH